MRITFDQWYVFSQDYFSGKFPNQRYGQAFCNFFNITDGKLFYEENKKQAIAYANTNYVDNTK